MFCGGIVEYSITTGWDLYMIMAPGGSFLKGGGGGGGGLK